LYSDRYIPKLEGLSTSLLMEAALKLGYIPTKIHDITFFERLLFVINTSYLTQTCEFEKAPNVMEACIIV